MTDKHTPVSREAVRKGNHRNRLALAAPAMYAGHEHVILHAEDRCDCGRSYGEIARAAIKAAKESA